ncbi:MAG: FAD-dependent oxidoreductase [Patescibacteria group bacterium]
MKRYDYLIIGGGVAGVTAAETIRAGDERATIGIVSVEPHPLYSRVLLPSYLKGRVNREAVFLRSADDFIKKRIDLLMNEEAVSLDTIRGVTVLASGQKAYWTSLLIASGGRVMPWGNAEDQSVIYRLQTIDDADRIRKNMPRARTPVVVGSSFIALEFLEIFAENGLTPALLSQASRYFDAALDDEGGAMIADHLQRRGITLHFNDGIAEMIVQDDDADITTRRGDMLKTNTVAVGIGIQPNVAFLAGSDIEHFAGGVNADAFLETNHPNVFAAGDIAYFLDPVTRVSRRVGNWTNAVLQGKIAGHNMLHKKNKQEFRAIPSYTITNFGWNITMVGDCNPEGTTTMTRRSPDKFLYERFFLKDDILAGAFLINAFRDKIPLTRLIERQTHLGDAASALRDDAFDISSIAP